MMNESLKHDQSYEWYGTFWFPTDNLVERYSGKVSYAPDKGVRLSLQAIDATNNAVSFFQGGKYLAKKTMYASVHSEDGLRSLTLFDVVISGLPSTFNEIQCSGSAVGLLCGAHLCENGLSGIELQYDDHYDSFFLNFLSKNKKEQAVIKFTKNKPLPMIDGWTIAFRAASLGGTFVSTPNDLDSIFGEVSSPILKKIKEAIAPILVKYGANLFKRNYTELRTSLSKDGQEFEKLLEQEYIWRFLFELLLDHPVSVLKAYGIYYETDPLNGEPRGSILPILCSNFVPIKQVRKPNILVNLPINFLKFGLSTEYIANLEICIQKWFKINVDDDWRPVIDGMNRLMKIDKAFGDTSQYSALKADIETFIELEKSSKGNIDTLIENAASKEWEKGVLSELSFSTKKTLGQHLTSIRDSIVHPVSTKGTHEEVYGKIRKDIFQLQIAYAYLGALFLKAVFAYLNVADDKNREEYLKKFIEQHARYNPIDFK